MENNAKTFELDTTIMVDPEDQGAWMDIIDASIYTIAGVARTYDINENQLRRYLKGQSKPQSKTMERVKTIMKKLVEQPRPPRHPLFGYATPDEVKRLNELGMGPERDRIMEAIAKRTKAKRKVNK